MASTQVTAVGKERSDLSSLPANVVRSMPYTAYIAVGSYAIISGSGEAAWLELCLLVNELLNALFKFVPARIVGKQASLLRRPAGAADSGIYPQHYPKVSSTSGMPSGHAQTSALLATIFTCHIVDLKAAEETATDSLTEFGRSIAMSAHAVSAVAYVWIVAIIVMTSRTRFGGPLRVSVGGRGVSQHTCLQVMVGAVIGASLGFSAYWCFHKRSGWWVGLLVAFAVLASVTAAAYLAENLSERSLKRNSRESGGQSDSTADSSSPGNGSAHAPSLESELEQSAESVIGSTTAERTTGYELVNTADQPVIGFRGPSSR